MALGMRLLCALVSSPQRRLGVIPKEFVVLRVVDKSAVWGKLVLLLVFAGILITGWLAVFGQQAMASSSAQGLPPFPEELPEMLVANSGEVLVAQDHQTVYKLQLPSGWQLVSFCTPRVVAVTGLPRMLLRLSSKGYRPVDAVHHPERIEYGTAYLTYFDKPTTVTFVGEKAKNKRLATQLHEGWNLVGYPSCKAGLNTSLTVSKPDGTVASLAQVCDKAKPGMAWISSQACELAGQRWAFTRANCRVKISVPGGRAAIYAMSPAMLNWNVAAPSGGVPKVGNCTPVAAPGSLVAIKGRYLGEQLGVLMLGDRAIRRSDIISWTPSIVKFRLPSWARSSSLSLFVEQYPAGTLPLKVAAKASAAATSSAKKPEAANTPTAQKPAEAYTLGNKETKPTTAKAFDLPGDLPADLPFDVPSSAGTKVSLQPQPSVPPHLAPAPKRPTVNRAVNSGDGTNGSVAGRIVDSAGNPLNDACVRLSSGQQALSDRRGEYTIGNVVPGDYGVSVSLPGYRSASGRVRVSAGQSCALKVSLSSTDGSSPQAAKPEERRGTFTVVGNNFARGKRDMRLWVSSIEVSEDGGGKTWKNTWWNDVGDTSTALTCRDATIGKRYNIYVTWRGRWRELRGSWSKKFEYSDETFTFEHP